MAVYEQKPGKLDLTLVAGDDFALPLTITGDRSAYTFTANLEPTPGGTSVSFTAGSATYSAGTGLTSLTLTLTSTQTDPLTGSYVWAARWTDGSSKLRTFLAGDVRVQSEVVG